MLVGTVTAGIPVSTTHAITSTISGVGVTSRFSAVRWGVARQIVWAWILSIPLSAVIAAASFALITLYLLF
jgi:PiT family inorganic phosphate transporter